VIDTAGKDLGGFLKIGGYLVGAEGGRLRGSGRKVRENNIVRIYRRFVLKCRGAMRVGGGSGRFSLANGDLLWDTSTY